MCWAHVVYGQEWCNLLAASDVELIRACQWGKAFAITCSMAAIMNKQLQHGQVHACMPHTIFPVEREVPTMSWGSGPCKKWNGNLFKAADDESGENGDKEAHTMTLVDS